MALEDKKLPERKKKFLLELELRVLRDFFLKSNDKNDNFNILTKLQKDPTEFLTVITKGDDYKPSDFDVKVMKLSTDDNGIIDFSMVQIDCPDWQNNFLCKRIFICHNTNLENPKYFTVEYNYAFSEDSFKLYENKLDGTRINHGEIEDDVEVQKKEVLDLYYKD